MSIDFKKLNNFIKVVDTGSLSKAAASIHIAQPALSQQIIALETHFRRKLVIRGNQGVVPTDAGRALYIHAQAILRHLDRVQSAIDNAGNDLSGRVSVGLATYSSAGILSLPLLDHMKRQYPSILIHINDSFGQILSELVMTGRMDMAIIYGSEPIKGVCLEPLLTEPLYLVGSEAARIAPQEQMPVAFEALHGLPLVLPSRQHALRCAIDDGLVRARARAHVAAEIESIGTMIEAIEAKLGCAILPRSTAVAIALGRANMPIRRLTKPTIEIDLSMCVSDNLALSEAASATKDALLQIAERMFARTPAF